MNFSQLDAEQRIEQVSLFSELLMSQIKSAVPVVPLVTIACVASDMPDSGLKKTEILERARRLNKQMESKGAEILFPNKDMLGNLEAALEMLCLRRILIVKSDLYYRANEAIPLLHYYRNSIAHWLKAH